MARNNRAASMEKERWGGEGYLDNRAGDRSTMAAVFSIRHYLIDRVAGLIVHGGYFRAAFVWGSAILPHPSLILSSLYPTPPPPSSLHLAPTEALLSVCGWRAGLSCLLSISAGQSVAGCMGRGRGGTERWVSGILTLPR